MVESFLVENPGNLNRAKKFPQIWILEEELDSDEHVDLVVPLLESLIQCFIYSFKAFITDLRCFLKKIMLIFNMNINLEI